MSSQIQISLLDGRSGSSDSMAVSTDMKVFDLIQLAVALFGLDGNGELLLIKDAKPLNPASTLQQAGVGDGDLLAVADRQSISNNNSSNNNPAPAPAPAAAGGGLDFSNLLGGSGAPASAASGGLNFSSILGNASGNAAGAKDDGSDRIPVYYAGMTLDDAMSNNPHPNQIVQLLKGPHPHLFKELNHHNPTLAQRIQSATFDQAVQIWREYTVKTGIQNAMRQTKLFQTQQSMTKRLQQNPDDAEAKDYFHKQEKQKEIQQQYFQAMQEYPESMGKVLMLYIETTINGHSVQTFVDSGAQVSVMSKSCARRCGLLDLVDTRFAGFALGVGKGKILGRVHIAHLKIHNVHFPCTITVMDSEGLPSAGATQKDMDFLLGLDMLKRHLCTIDLASGVLRFPTQNMETPFLHEKDLDESKGGTKGFNAEEANMELEKQMQEAEKKAADDDGDGDGKPDGGDKKGDGSGDDMQTS